MAMGAPLFLEKERDLAKTEVETPLDSSFGDDSLIDSILEIERHPSETDTNRARAESLQTSLERQMAKEEAKGAANKADADAQTQRDKVTLKAMETPLPAEKERDMADDNLSTDSSSNAETILVEENIMAADFVIDDSLVALIPEGIIPDNLRTDDAPISVVPEVSRITGALNICSAIPYT